MFGNATRGKRLRSQERIIGTLPFVTAGETNSGISAYIDNEVEIFKKNTITIDMFGSAKYRHYDYGADDHVAVVHTENIGKFSAIFVTAAIHKASHAGQFDYSRNFYAKDADTLTISLPITSEGAINYDFMEEFIATLEEERVATLKAYLSAAGLSDYTLTQEEQETLNNLHTVTWKEFRLGELFENIVQGRRLKKQDHITGKLPFVMSGTTNNGIAGYISNKVEIFPKNSITVDIFGNVFYRNYEYGLGDDTAAYWNKNKVSSKEAMLFLSASIQKGLYGKYSYGHKLRGSQSHHLTISLPITSEAMIDYDFMEKFISAMQKITIKNVIEYLDLRLDKTKEITDKN